MAGRALTPSSDDLAQALCSAPRVIVAHGAQADPIFFGNRAALDRFDVTLDAFTEMPSRQSAKPMLREARQALLERVARDGFIDDYSCIRISATSRRFRIEQATVWNLIDEQGAVHGQAATFDRRVEL